MSITEQRERLRRARAELEPLVKGDPRINAILNQLTKMEADLIELPPLVWFEYDPQKLRFAD